MVPEPGVLRTLMVPNLMGHGQTQPRSAGFVVKNGLKISAADARKCQILLDFWGRRPYM